MTDRLDPSYHRHITFACTGCYQLHTHHRLGIITLTYHQYQFTDHERMDSLVSYGKMYAHNICHWINGLLAKIVLRDLDLLFKVNNLKRYYLWNGESKRKYACDDFCRFWYMPSNDLRAKIVLPDLDLLFECKQSEILRFWYCQQMSPLRILYPMIVLQVRNLKC